MKMKKLVVPILVALPLVSSMAHADEPAPMDMRAALIRTLAGPINGPLVIGVIPAGSPQLTMISQMTGSAEPAKIAMTKIKEWGRPGCGRLKLVFHQDKMKLKAGGTGNNFYMTQYLDVCSDGSVPEVPVVQPQAGGTPAVTTKTGK